MNTKEPVFLDEYPKSEALCSYLLRQIGSIPYGTTILEKSANLNSREIAVYTNPQEKPFVIDKGFIQNIYNLTHCDMDELNRIASSSSESKASPEPCAKSEVSPEPCVTFNHRPVTFLQNILKNEGRDPHYYQFFADIQNIFQLPSDTREQIQSIIHDIVAECMSSPNHQLLRSERSLGYIDRYMDRLLEEPDPKLTSPEQDTASSEKEPDPKSAARRSTLLEEAQRAHFVDSRFHVAKKFYVKIIQCYRKSKAEEYYISCLNLLSLYHSPLTRRNLSFGETPIEKGITDSLKDADVWKQICEIFNTALLSKNGNPKRSRKRKVGNKYK